ncbi:hypothetical protein GE061_013166 [Apolygus lucorum]|uniref:Lipase domain-containing protein n=1 Tax=Apolygus lucorum TaxID=248454 RepID=A0A8S9XUC5_APOLU|nr:hypothetical protein GE061_013166 [Apolygus lucorum]
MRAALFTIVLALSGTSLYCLSSHEDEENDLDEVNSSVTGRISCEIFYIFGLCDCDTVVKYFPVKYVLSVSGEGNFTEEPKTPYTKLNSEQFFSGKLDPQKETVILIHGFLHGCDHKFIQQTTATYLKFRPDVQVIAVCWSAAFPDLEKRVGGLLSLMTFPAAYQVTKCIGRTVASFIEHLHDDLSVAWDKLTVVAHSLGTQVAGAAGNRLPSLKTIIALDPTWRLPLLNNFKADSANNVVVVHTSKSLGTPWPAGTADFYANLFKLYQPGCFHWDLIKIFQCNHFRSVELFIEAVQNPKAFKATQFLWGKSAYFSPDTKAKGKFYFITNEMNPEIEAGSPLDAIDERPQEELFLLAENKSLREENELLRQQLNEAKSEILRLKEFARILEKKFTVSQQQSFMQGRCSQWTSDDIAKAITLRYDGFQLETGQLVTKDAFISLIEHQSEGDLKYAHKISSSHLLVFGSERQNVRKAAELLSNTVGQAISHNFPEWQHVGETVTTINNGFDVLNARFPICESNVLKSAYGNSLEKQNEALHKLEHFITSMKLIKKPKKNGTLMPKKPTIELKKPAHLPFQQGFLISINSLRGLFDELKKEGYFYVLPSRCNQDVLESFFSQLRGLGRFYDHPLPNTVSQRVKSLILSRRAGIVFNNLNCPREKDVETLSVSVIEPLVRSDSFGHHETSNNYNNKDGPSASDADEMGELILKGHEIEQIELENEFEENFDEYPDKKSEELLEMLAGYLIYRFKKKQPEKSALYGSYSKDVPTSSKKTWVGTLSRGWLIRPNESFMKDVKAMEEEFIKYHGKGINKNANVFSTLKTRIQESNPHIDDFLVLCYVRTRTFIRMKNLNREAREKKLFKKRSSSGNRQNSKKMKKIIT